MRRSRSGRPHLVRQTGVRVLALVSLGGAAIAVAGPVAAPPASSPRLGPVASSTCPDPFPLSALKVGQQATGWTTHKGMTPSKFSVRILGVLHNAIAPGVDMIVVKASSPAITRAGGTWAGMSGSPIYANDGRLIGSLSYGLAWGPSKSAGLTPARAMYDVLDFSRTSVLSFARHVALTPSVQRAVVTSGAASASAAAGGFTQLPTPVGVSGASPRQLNRLEKQFAGEPFTFYRAGSASARVADTSKIRPGAPIAVSASYGAFTYAGTGTVTAVCGKRVLAFGHPMMALGQTTEGAHLAKVLFVEKETLGAPFVVADVRGLVGTVTQDRLTAVRARLGDPAPASKIVADVSASTGLHRVGTTYSTFVEWLPNAAANAAYGELWSTLQADSGGSAFMTWKVTGHRAHDKAWSYTRTDRTAAAYSVGYSIGDLLYFPLSTIVDNPFEKVTVDKVSITVRASEVQREYVLTKLRVLQGAKYVLVQPDTVLQVAPGDAISLRAVLSPYKGIGGTQRVELTLRVPADVLPGSGQLTVFGGADTGGFYPGDGEGDGRGDSAATSFDDVLAQLAAVPRNDNIYAELGMSDENGNMTTADRDHQNVKQVVRGTISVQVLVPGGEEPPPPVEG